MSDDDDDLFALSGSKHARTVGPNTSRLAGASVSGKLKLRACLFIFILDRDEGLTALDVERFCDLPTTRDEYGPRPLGVSPWRRVTDCFDAGWARVMIDDHGNELSRLEAYGKHQQVFRITPTGRVKALELINNYEAA